MRTGDHQQDNIVLTVVAHPSLQGVVTTPLTHYSLARLYSEVLAAEPLGQAAAAASMAMAFGLDLGPLASMKRLLRSTSRPLLATAP